MILSFMPLAFSNSGDSFFKAVVEGASMVSRERVSDSNFFRFGNVKGNPLGRMTGEVEVGAFPEEFKSMPVICTPICP